MSFDPTTWLREQGNKGPFLCTPQYPMPADAKGFTFRHTQSMEISSTDEIATYECQCCGHRWTVELAQ